MTERTIETELDSKQIDELEDRRLGMMEEANINEADVLAEAHQNIVLWNGYFNENYTRGKDDMNFVLRDQWTAVERSEFQRLFKPAMTFNKLYDVCKKVIGEQRKNKPDLQVRSITGRASQEQIDLRSDLVRTIAYQNQTDLVYQTAFKSALMMGYGAFQVQLEYETNKSFNQTIRYGLIPDATRVSFDPTALMPHKGDGNFCARNYVLTKEEFGATYPYINNPISYIDPRTLLDFQWETRDTIVLCDYYQKDWYSCMAYKLSNGMFVTEDEWEAMQPQIEILKELNKGSDNKIIQEQIPTIVMKRQTQDYKIRHYRLVKNAILEFSEWPSRQLPIIFVDGDSHFIEGMQYTRSFIHEAKDAQRFHNYVKSEAAAEIKNRRREQWLGTPDNIKGQEQMWRNPELQMGMLMATPDPKTGTMPQKQQAWEISQSLLSLGQATGQDMREILGFSENEELQGRDMSGKARRERKLEGSMSAMVFFDNFNQAIEQGGRVVLDLLPVIAGNDERHFIVSKPDGRSESIILNKQKQDGSWENRLEPGDYDIEIDTGPSFAVQKEIALEFFQETLQAAPQTFGLVADLWAKNLDIQYRDQVAERFKTLVPPEIIAKEEGLPPPPPKPNPEEQMMQMQQQLHQADMQEKMGALQERAHELQIREQKHEIEKMEILMKAHELQEKLQSNKVEQAIDLHKSGLSYKAQLAKIMADLEKSQHQARDKHAGL